MKQIFFSSLVVIYFISCSGNKKQIPLNENAVITKDSFFPVTSFIKGQLLELDSLPVTPLYSTTIKEKTDSAWIKREALRSMLQAFLTPVITETNFNEYFKETKFKDETIHAFTFAYDPVKALPDTLSLRQWDVYVNPETGKVTKVYMVKQLKEGDKNLTLQLTWQTGEWAKITTILNKPDGSTELIKEEKFTWDFSE